MEKNIVPFDLKYSNNWIKIQLKKNGMHLVEKVLEKKLYNKFKKHLSMPLYLGMG
jgi:hypothetical protein